MRGASTSDQPFTDLQELLLDLYQRGEYEQALDLLGREVDHFPLQMQRLYYWQICLAALVGNKTMALQLLEELVAEGYWLPEGWLKQEPELRLLQGDLTFERLVEICSRRQTNAQEHTSPQLVTMLPVTQMLGIGSVHPMLLALHGNFRNIRNSIDIWRPAVEKGWLLALPQSSQIFGPGSYIWDDRERATEEIQRHVESLRRKYRLLVSRSVVAGFSTGGTLAIWLALSGAIAIRGFIAVSPVILKSDLERWSRYLDMAHARGIQGYILMGERDQRRYPEVKDLLSMLHERKIPCTLEVTGGLGHDFPPDFAQSLPRILETVTANGRL